MWGRPGPAPSPQPRHQRRPHSRLLSPLRSDLQAIETAARCSAAPKHQLQEEGAAARGGAGWRRSRGWGGGLEGGTRRRARQAEVLGSALLSSLVRPYTMKTV